mmetsp:Transcript_11735/g.25042  ORF Transcript_11735/g.25042 Transcript_11735/m.25042 type:complete len:231 (+) Transcript_11735:1-693(+)
MYATPFWRNKGLSGAVWTSAGVVAGTVRSCASHHHLAHIEQSSLLFAYRVLLISAKQLLHSRRTQADAFTPDGSGRLVCFILGRDAETMQTWTESERRNVVIRDLVKIFGSEASQPIGYADHNWNDETYSKGCFGGLHSPGLATLTGDALRNPVGRIHWAGSETALLWSGYIEGAVESGERVAVEVVQAMRRTHPSRALQMGPVEAAARQHAAEMAGREQGRLAQLRAKL